MIYRKVKYKYSFDNKEPNVSSTLIGEIELNLSENNECLYLKTQEGKLAKLPLNGKLNPLSAGTCQRANRGGKSLCKLLSL